MALARRMVWCLADALQVLLPSWCLASPLVSNQVGVTTMERLEQGHPHPKLRSQDCQLPAGNWTRAPTVGGEHPRKSHTNSLLKALQNIYIWARNKFTVLLHLLPNCLIRSNGLRRLQVFMLPELYPNCRNEGTVQLILFRDLLCALPKL